MHSIIRLSLSFMLCISLQAKEVRDITSIKELKEQMGQPKPLVIMFYAPWCGACKEMKEALNRASTLLGTEASVVKIDLENKSMSEAADLFNIEAIPTIIIKHTGRVLAEDLVAAIKSLTKKPAIQQKKDNPPKKESSDKKIETKPAPPAPQKKKTSPEKPTAKPIQKRQEAAKK